MRRVLTSCTDSVICNVLDVDGPDDNSETSGSWRKRPGVQIVTNMQQMQLKHHQRADSDEEETCRFPKLQECAHFHYERVQLCPLQVSLQVNNGDISIHSLQHTSRGSDENPEEDWYTVQVTSNNECWLLQRTLENFVKLDSQLHQCIFDRKVSQLTELTHHLPAESVADILTKYLERFCQIIDNSLNCGPILTWFQLDNRGHRLLVPNEESDSINTPAVAAAYSIKKYVSQARDELNLEVGDMISVIDMASPGESMWWRGKRGFQVGFFPQHCVHVIGEKLACLPHAPNALGSAGSGTVSPIKPVLRKHGKLIAFFRSFILNRPSRRRLKQSGILRERVFGCDLGEHLLNSRHEIPMVLKCCAEFIESHGIVDGIYRLSGVTSNIQKLRNAFDEDRIPNLYTEDILQDIHSVASLLKMYFRELPNPLCTHQLYHSFVNAVQGTQINSNGEQIKVDENERLLRMRETVHKLPPPHYRTLEYLMRHLARVAKHGARTGMTSRNVAIVWAPNLLRCAELEIGGVAALQGVGVQAVVTEFLVCYTDLIFCDNLPTADSDTDTMANNTSSLSPKKLRPKSLALSTPTKLLSLEEARSKHLLSNKPDESSYIEVGGGPKNLPEKYHTVLELPQGFRKRSMSKRSPLGWRSFFTKSRNTSHTNLAAKNTIRKASTPGINTSFQEKSVTESDLTEIRRKLRPVKSAESLTSGQSEPPSTEIDTLGPLHCLNKPSGHNRSVSHDSYFDTLQASNNNSEGSLLDLSEIQLNFELEESEMRIFSEDESLVSSPRVHKESGTRKVLHRARPEDFNSQTNSSNPSPKKQPRVILSPESQSRKRSRLEDQLSDILYIDCNTPENMISTTAIVHTHPEKTPIKTPALITDDPIEPKNKSPRNSNEIQQIKAHPEENLVKPEPENLFKKNTNRNSLNLENYKEKNLIPKSYTEMDLKRTLQIPSSSDVCSEVSSTNISPQTPNYNRLYGETTDSSDSTTTTPNQISPDFSLTESPGEISYKIFNRNSGETKDIKISNTYENIANELSNNGIISPKKTPSSPTYENVLTTISITYSLNSPSKNKTFVDKKQSDTNIYEDIEINSELKATIPTSVANLPNREASQPTEIVYRTKVTNIDELLAAQKQKSSPTSPNAVKTTSPPAARPTSLSFSPDSNPANYVSPIRPISLSFQANNYAENSETPIYENVEVNEEDNSQSFPTSPSKPILLNEKRKSCENSVDDDAIYQQVKYFRRSIHEINELLDKPLSVSSNNSIVNSPEQIQDVPKLNSIVNSPEQVQDVSNSIVEQTSTPEKLQETDVTDSSTPEDVKIVPENNVQYIENSSNIVNIEQVVNENDTTAHVSVVDVCMPEENEERCKISDEETIDNMSDKFDSLEMEKTVIIEEENENEESTPPPKIESPKVKPHQRHRTESVREIANKFENLDPTSSSECSSIVLRYKDINGRDSLPPCLRHARHTKLLKNNPKARSLDENEFIREFVTKPLTTFSQQAIINQTTSASRRKSLDERLNRFTIAQPKQLNQPKVLPDTAKKSPDFHSLHSFHAKKSTDSLSSSTSSLKQSNILKDIKNNTKDHDESTDQHPSLSSTSLNSTTDFENPQLNRERIERYKEERRNFLREKYRSESFRADNKDQVLTRLKSKIKPRGEENKDDVVEDDVNRRNNKLKSNNENIESPVLNQRNIKRNEKIIDGCEVIKNNQIRKNNTIISDYTKKFSGSDNNTDKSNNTTMGTIRSDNMNNEKGVRKKDYFDNKITQRREKTEELICASNEIRRHTFDTLMARERDSEFDREKRISLDSKLSNRSPKKEKRSPSYIKDMTAMFESKSNNQS
ncbi:GTPase-activating protein CdGAPr isoform X2 [Chrysoperla carnea]|uniref:GTPase-activating protein CdGAPr isoform X2 n=1 Tax=Chrysoperla carnea TaxID=189513 RepID=UPI001D09327D|nr:GTPase-activating protein CdGAPr isoform X2 [Chrysoperla carnea]